MGERGPLLRSVFGGAVLQRSVPFVLISILAVSTAAAAAKTAAKRIVIAIPSTTGPMAFGANDLKSSLARAGFAPSIVVESARLGTNLAVVVSAGKAADIATRGLAAVPAKAESFAIARRGNTILVAGRDAVGAMYGLLELAERVSLDGANALVVKHPVAQSPLVEFRATNPFLSFPYEGERNWWFLSEDYWKTYLDLLARSRFNWVDLHGMYEIGNTGFPNIFPNFVGSKSFPLAGVPAEERERNLKMLNKIIAMAKDRGIKVALMSYRADWNVPGREKPPYEQTEENLALYTREVVSELIRRCPDLAMIGFRIGESGKKEDFYLKSYIPGIAQSGRNIALYTRTWGAKKDSILELGRRFPGRFFIEIKYNGEQYGPPYIIAGGRMTKWRDYSYQSYLNYPQAYKVIWQIRANGTHRVFPWGSPERVARTARTCGLGGSIGFCVEPINAYYPQGDFRHPDDSPHKYWNWGHERDWFWNTLWGRLSYNPDVPERVWVKMFEDRFGKTGGRHVYGMMVSMSEIVPKAYTFYSLGPDHRHHAPELETGGGISKWAGGAPFDTQCVQPPREYAESLLENKPTGRMSPYNAANEMERAALDTIGKLADAKRTVPKDNKEFQCLATDALAMANLALYYAERLRGAVEYALAEAANSPAHLERAREHVASSHELWKRLAEIESGHYKPFVDTLRMHTHKFTWAEEARKLDDDQKDLDQLAEQIKGKPEKTVPKVVSDDGGAPRIRLAAAEIKDISPDKKRLSVRVSVTGGVEAVYLKHKPFPSEIDWQLMRMKAVDGEYSAELDVTADGALWCVVAAAGDGGSQYPDFMKETPYLVISPWEVK